MTTITLLHVDDEESVLRTMRRVFERAGFEVFGVRNGASALEFLEHVSPDVIILDVCMPDENGFDLCRRIRRYPSMDAVPIVMFTGLDDEETLQEALEVGASDWIAKPSSATEVLMRVRMQVERTMREREVREAQQAALRAAESAQRYETLFEGAAEGILVGDAETRICTMANQSVAQLLGYQQEELLGMPLSAFFTPDDLDAAFGELKAQLADEKGLTPEVPLLHNNGTRVYADLVVNTVVIDGRPCVVGFLSDVTERQEMESRLADERARRESIEVELRHAQKMEAVGQLAAGIAHEINTPAQFVGDSVGFVRDAYEDLRALLEVYRTEFDRVAAADGMLGERVREAEEDADMAYLDENVPAAFERSLDGLSRVASIVGAMKEFAHPDQREKSAADLNHAIENTLAIARNEYKYVADVETDLGELPPVPCHLGDLNQVFLNLIVNAAHAIEARTGSNGERGLITIRSRVTSHGVRLQFSDNGCGIPAAIRQRIFDPFFTTKEVGKGSGQGLSITHTIVVDNHQGAIAVESREGEGTTFTLFLPLEVAGADSSEATTPAVVFEGGQALDDGVPAR